MKWGGRKPRANGCYAVRSAPQHGQWFRFAASCCATFHATLACTSASPSTRVGSSLIALLSISRTRACARGLRFFDLSIFGLPPSWPPRRSATRCRSLGCTAPRHKTWALEHPRVLLIYPNMLGSNKKKPLLVVKSAQTLNSRTAERRIPPAKRQASSILVTRSSVSHCASRLLRSRLSRSFASREHRIRAAPSTLLHRRLCTRPAVACTSRKTSPSTTAHNFAVASSARRSAVLPPRLSAGALRAMSSALRKAEPISASSVRRVRSVSTLHMARVIPSRSRTASKGNWASRGGIRIG